MLRESTRVVDRLELDLMVAAKYEAIGRADKAEWPTLLIRHGDVDDWTTRACPSDEAKPLLRRAAKVETERRVADLEAVVAEHHEDPSWTPPATCTCACWSSPRAGLSTRSR